MKSTIFIRRSDHWIKMIIWIILSLFVISIVAIAIMSNRSLTPIPERKNTQDALNQQVAQEIILEKEDENIELATFDNLRVTVKDFYNFFKRIPKEYRQIYVTKQHREMLFDYFLRAKIKENAAKKLEIEEEKIQEKIDEFIKNFPNKDSYNIWLTQNNFTEAMLREEIVMQLKDQKLFDQVIEMINIENEEEITDEKIKSFYEEHKARYKQEDEYHVKHIFAKFDELKIDESKITTTELVQFYETHKANYKFEKQANIKHILLKTDDKRYLDQVKLSENELKEYYDQNLIKYEKEEEVKASHILIKTDDKKEEEALKKANEVYEKAIQEGASFEELAKLFSEGPTNVKGGDLGYFNKQTMVKEFSDKAFSMKIGEISEPVLTQFGYHIIKLYDKKEAHTKSFEDVKAEIKVSLQKEKVETIIKEIAENIKKELNDNPEKFEEKVKEFSSGKSRENGGDLGWFYLGVIPSDFDKSKIVNEITTGYSIDSSVQFAINNLEKGKISDVVKSSFGFHIIKLIDTKEPAIKPYEIAKKDVLADLKFEKAEKQAKEKIDIALEKVKSGSSFEEVAKNDSDGITKDQGGEIGFLIKNERNYEVLKDFIGELFYGYSMPEEITQAIFSLNENSMSEVIRSEFGYHIFKVYEIQKDKTKSLEKVKDDIVESLKTNIVTKEEIAKHFEENKSKFEVKTKYDLSIILLGNVKIENALTMFNELKNGEDFGKMARLHSKSSTASNDGKLGLVSLEETPFGDEFAKKVKLYSKNDIVEPVRTNLGFVIAKVNDIQEGKEAVLDEDTKDKIKKELLKPKQDKEFQKYLDEIYNNTVIVKKEENFSLLAKY